MSSKRGRKRNDNLPPNRARDVQRAFRARRAAHLRALEDRVSELQEENDYLRRALQLPPSNRPPLGRGPTGKDKPSSPQRTSNASPFASSRESSSNAESPPSRQTSISPSGLIPVSMSPSRPSMTLIDGSAWDESRHILRDHSQVDNSSPETRYRMPYTPSVSPENVHHSSYSNTTASSSQQSNPFYAHATHPSTLYSQVPHIPAPEFSTPNYSIRSEFTQNGSRPGYSYTSESYPSSGSAMEYSGPPNSGDFHHHSQTPHTQSLDPSRQLHHPQPSRHAQVFQDRDHQQDLSLVQVRNQGGGHDYTIDHSAPSVDLQTQTHAMDYIPRTHISSFAAVPRLPYAPDNGRPQM